MDFREDGKSRWCRNNRCGMSMNWNSILNEQESPVLVPTSSISSIVGPVVRLSIHQADREAEYGALEILKPQRF